MPTYDLRCEGCGHDFEAFRQGFLRDEDRVCPACGAANAAQRFTGGFVAVTSSRGAAPAPAGGGCGGACGCGGH